MACQNRWLDKTDGLSLEVNYIPNLSIPRNVTCQARWPVIGGGLFARFDYMYSAWNITFFGTDIEIDNIAIKKKRPASWSGHVKNEIPKSRF